MADNELKESSANPADDFVITPVTRPRQQIEAQLREAILSGVFHEGSRLPSETTLSAQFKVSRGTVREALRGLVETGLISKVAGANGGSFITYFDHHMLSNAVREQLSNTLELGSISYDEVASFRDLLEVPASRLAALNRTEEQLSQLHDVIDQEKHASVNDPDVMIFNAHFHNIIAQATGNRLIIAVINALHRVAHPIVFIDKSPELGKLAVLQHIEIVSAITAKDPDLAEKCMQTHLDYLRANASPVYKEKPSELL